MTKAFLETMFVSSYTLWHLTKSNEYAPFDGKNEYTKESLLKPIDEDDLTDSSKPPPRNFGVAPSTKLYEAKDSLDQKHQYGMRWSHVIDVFFSFNYLYCTKAFDMMKPDQTLSINQHEGQIAVIRERKYLALAVAPFKS